MYCTSTLPILAIISLGPIMLWFPAFVPHFIETGDQFDKKLGVREQLDVRRTEQNYTNGLNGENEPIGKNKLRECR
jgi:hypothetical protein